MDNIDGNYTADERQRSAQDKATSGDVPRSSNLREEERSDADFGFATNASASKPASPRKLQPYKTVS